MPLNLTDALNQYGFVGDLANSIPELKGIFAEAARDEWDPAQFQRAIMDTDWWKANSEAARSLATLQVTDPATYNQNWDNAASKVYLMAQQMGRMQGLDARGIAMMALANNWDDDQIRSYIGTSVGVEVWEGAVTGQAGQLQAHLKELVANYGIPATENWITAALGYIQGGHETLEGYENIIRARAKAAFPQFAAQIDSGMTVRDIADPYISTMANTLEVSETEIGLNDQWVQKALSQQQPDGRMDAMPLWEFERKLKDDPRWDKTGQARTQAFETVAQVGRDFGLSA